MKKFNKDTASGLFLAVFAVVVWFYLDAQNMTSTQGMSPASFPKLILVCMCILGLMIAGFSIGKDDVAEIKIKHKIILLTLGLLFVYMLAMEYVGYIISTIIFLPLCMYLFGERRPKYLILIPIILTVGVYILFKQIFGIILP